MVREAAFVSLSSLLDRFDVDAVTLDMHPRLDARLCCLLLDELPTHQLISMRILAIVAQQTAIAAVMYQI